MRIGITFGCYAPLHQGHLDLMMRAKKENDLTFVVVAGYNGEERVSSIGLTFQAKYVLIKNFLEDELLKVIKINDTELGIDESESPENWTIWTQEVYRLISDTIKDKINDEPVTFCWYVAEPRYKESLDKYSCMKAVQEVIFVDRTLNPISGTKCRENPLKYWNRIAQPFRATLTHKILISGTASEGKTTLTRDIAKYFGLVYSYEKGRDNSKWKADNEFDGKDFIYNMYEQRNLNEQLMNSKENTGILVSDTDNIVTLMYAKAYAKKEGFNLTENDYKVLCEIARIYRPTTYWNKIFLLKPHEKPIVDDGERWMDDSDYEVRRQYFEVLKSLYDDFGYTYEILDGTYYENYLRVKEYIESLSK